MGAVYIVQMSDDAEHLEHLREIRDAQAALQKVLHSFDLDEGALDSEAAINSIILLITHNYESWKRNIRSR